MQKYYQPKGCILLFSIVLCLLFSSNSFAQNPGTVSGIVKDTRDGQPIPGVSILVKGTSRGTTTNIDGKFSIQASSNETLVFSFIGYTIEERLVGNSSSIDVSLASSMEELGEFLLIGYGSQRKADVTSAISEIDLRSFADLPIPNASRLLQGQAAGVQVRQQNGTPGQEFEVRVRGISSLGAGSDPLYVIDGFPVGNSIGQILNPNDIESISILKDAASTAVFGARGANGVVLITTKQAAAGKTKITFSSNTGIQNIPSSRVVSVLNAQQFVQFQNERVTDDFRRINGRDPLPNEIPAAWRNPGEQIPSTNWFNEITNQNALQQDYNLSVMTGTDKSKTMVSLGYLKQQGSIIETDFRRFNARINHTNKINDLISFDWNLAGTFSDRNNPGRFSGNFTESVINASYLVDPRDPVYLPDGSLNPYVGGRDGVFGYPSPVYVLKNETNYSSNGIVLTNGALNFNLAKGLTFRSMANVIYDSGRSRFFRPSTIGGFAVPPPQLAFGSESSFTRLNYGWDNILTYSPTLQNQNLELTAGYVIQKESINSLTGTGTQFPDDLVPFISAAAERQSTSSLTEWSLLAYFARANYSLKDKYLFTATFRREGSSRFGANNKYGNFPSVSAGWRISEESFFPKSNVVNDLKFRGSWGITGNNNIGNYTHLARLGVTNYVLNNQLVPGRVLSTFGNPDLAWETSRQWDLGFDLTLFSGKVTFVTEWYRRLTSDMLLAIQVPSHTGFTTALSNIGEVENKGVEFTVVYQDRFGELGVNSNFNISFNRNKILSINNQTNELFTSNNFYGGNSIFRVGQPVGMLFGFVVDGIFQNTEQIQNNPSHPANTPGTYKYRDVNGDGKITYDTQDWDIIGNPHPKFTWGYNLNLSYKRFDLTAMFVGMHGFDLYRNIEHFTMNVDGVFNTSTKMMDRWRSEQNPGGNFWASTGNFQFTREANSRFVYDASHIWFRTLSIGYTLPSIKDKYNLRLFTNIDNLALFTSYPGNNPQANTGDPLNPQSVTVGVDNDHYPVPRIFSFGLNLNF